MRASLLLAVAPFMAYAAFVDSSVDKHVQALQRAQSLKTTFSVSKVGGSTDEMTLELSRPNFLKWDGPAKSVVSDGKILWTYDKGSKTYSKAEANDAAIAKAMGDDVVWAWSAFFDKDFAASLTSAQKGSQRKVRNMAVSDITVVRKDKRSFVLPLLDESGVAVGSRFSTDSGETIVLAKEFVIGDKPLEGSSFAWTPPADAKDAAEAAANALPFAEVKGIFEANCAGCHSGPAPKGGINLSSYDAIIASRAVRPGNSKSSQLMRVIRSGKMPPAGPLAAESQAKLAKWIDDGAKN